MGSAGDRRGKAGETGGEKERGGSLGEDRGGCWVMKEIMTREREKKGEACFLCISPRNRSRNQHPSIQDSHLPLDREPIAPATYPSAQPLK